MKYYTIPPSWQEERKRLADASAASKAGAAAARAEAATAKQQAADAQAKLTPEMLMELFSSL